METNTNSTNTEELPPLYGLHYPRYSPENLDFQKCLLGQELGRKLKEWYELT